MMKETLTYKKKVREISCMLAEQTARFDPNSEIGDREIQD